jgi:hypothetical protein
MPQYESVTMKGGWIWNSTSILKMVRFGISSVEPWKQATFYLLIAT